jgi:hypothetical protein
MSNQCETKKSQWSIKYSFGKVSYFVHEAKLFKKNEQFVVDIKISLLLYALF